MFLGTDQPTSMNLPESPSLEELPAVKSYVKNQFLGFTVSYVKDGEDHSYHPDFIARIATEDGWEANLMIITGMNRDKAEKKWCVENRWLSAVKTVQVKYGLGY